MPLKSVFCFPWRAPFVIVIGEITMRDLFYIRKAMPRNRFSAICRGQIIFKCLNSEENGGVDLFETTFKQRSVFGENTQTNDR